LIEKWANLHGVRAALGIAAIFIFPSASIA